MYNYWLNFLKKIPIPMCGLILGLVSLGNLFFSIHCYKLSYLYGGIGLFLMSLILLKIFFTLDHIVLTLNDPVVASVSPTFTMSLMVICVFFSHFFPNNIFISIIWYLSVLLHFILMIYFVAIHIFPTKITLEHIYPSWFITFVGIGVISNTSVNFNIELGKIIIWIALFFYLILLPIIIYRIFIYKNMHISTFPLITIMTAPGSLCLVGYLSVTENKNVIFVVTLFLLSQLIYSVTIILLIQLLKIPFYPSYAAFTFPLVISATAVKESSGYLSNYIQTSWLDVLTTLEIGVATLVVTYVTIRYLFFLVNQFKQLVTEKSTNKQSI